MSESNIIHNNTNKCIKCEKIIKGEMINAFDNNYCKECFTCTVCNCNITSYYVLDGKASCKDCYDKKNATECQKCKKSIIGSKLTDNGGRQYHVDCFTCEKCNCKIGGSYFIRNEQPYCANCNNELKEQVIAQNSKEVGQCFKCKKSIINSTPMVIVKPEEKYHQACLKCHKCNELIQGQFQVLDDITSKNYICMKCN